MTLQNFLIFNGIHLLPIYGRMFPPLANAQPQSKIFPPPCLRFGRVFFSIKCWYIVLHTFDIFICPQHLFSKLFWYIQMLLCRLQTMTFVISDNVSFWWTAECNVASPLLCQLNFPAGHFQSYGGVALLFFYWETYSFIWKFPWSCRSCLDFHCCQ